jgi:hypothetical protein
MKSLAGSGIACLNQASSNPPAWFNGQLRQYLSWFRDARL